MKTLELPLVAGFEDLEKFALAPVDHVCWPGEFPYAPVVNARLAHTADAILVRFDVTEKNVKAVATENNGNVWEDSCVEFFVKVPGSENYFNFETNCIGVGLAAKRRSRSDCDHFDDATMARIERRSSLPLQIIDTKGDCTWSLELKVPFDLLGCEDVPEELFANLYKCGDKTEEAHFLSWNPVLTEKPDFHRPEYFGKLIMK